MKRINFTKVFLNNLSIPEKGRVVYQDIRERGLNLYITKNSIKTFFVRKRVKGIDEKIIIGRYPDISIDGARRSVCIIKSKIAQGINPNTEKSEFKQEIAFDILFNQYLEKYAKIHKKSWKEDLAMFNRYLKDLANKKLSLITNEVIRTLYHKVGENNGKYAANRMLALIRVVFNKAIIWGLKKNNPALGIQKFKEKSRDRFIQPDELPRFFKSLDEELNDVAKCYIYMSLYTGARKNNVLAMKWKEVNFTTNQWRIPDTKNNESLTLPLIKQAMEVLEYMKQYQKCNDIQTKYVFYSQTSKSGHFEEPKSAWKRILKRANIENLRLHDIRRTLGSYQAIGGTSLHIIGKSLGHKSQQATQIYARMNLDPVRESVKNAISLIESYKE